MLGKDNVANLKRYDRGETDSDVALSDRAPGILHDAEDEYTNKIDKMVKDVNDEYSKRPKVTVKAL